MHVYSSKSVKVIWGTESLWDYTDTESGVQVYADFPAWRLVLGTDGEVARVRRSNFPGRVVVNLSQHTTANRNLLAKLIVDAQTGVLVAPLTILDNMAALSFSAPLAFIEGLPQHGWQQTTSSASWVFVCPMLVPATVPGVPTLFTS